MNSDLTLTLSTVTIPKSEYQQLKADSLFADMAGDILDELPISIGDLLRDDPRWPEWLKMANPERYEEEYGDDSPEP